MDEKKLTQEDVVDALLHLENACEESELLGDLQKIVEAARLLIYEKDREIKEAHRFSDERCAELVQERDKALKAAEYWKRFAAAKSSFDNPVNSSLCSGLSFDSHPDPIAELKQEIDRLRRVNRHQRVFFEKKFARTEDGEVPICVDDVKEWLMLFADESDMDLTRCVFFIVERLKELVSFVEEKRRNNAYSDDLK